MFLVQNLSIPTSKIQRASKLIQTGAKVGVNYLKYYGDKLVKTEEEAKDCIERVSILYKRLKESKASASTTAKVEQQK